VIGADTDPADIVIDIADLVGHSATYLGIDKVMNPDFLRATLGTPFSASVAKNCPPAPSFSCYRNVSIIPIELTLPSQKVSQKAAGAVV
jgi:hypothetical protein